MTHKKQHKERLKNEETSIEHGVIPGNTYEPDGGAANPTRNRIGDTFTAISAGNYHSMAIKTDGSLWAWGDNSFGQLGNGTTTKSSTPIKIMDDVKQPGDSTPVTLAPKPDTPVSEYIYDEADPGALVNLPADKLATVKENKKDFSDISGKSKEMQNAISVLASKGIINGTSAASFSPDGTITRSEMKYKDPSNASGVLDVYTDASAIPSWGTTDIALATRENLIVMRKDGRFNPTATMTRGDAAIILYRMFMKIW